MFTSPVTRRQASCSTATTSIKPKNVMPIHGEYRHLMANAKLAKKTGIPEQNIIVAEDGSVVDLVGGKAEIVGKIPCDMLYVDGQAVGKITEEDLQDRRTLAAEGSFLYLPS